MRFLKLERQRVKNFFCAFLLILVTFLLITTNYSWGSFLSGWDTLHPEFNFSLYFQRIFWGVWQQHQGLGAVAAQAHASEIGRLWYLTFGGIFLPLDFFRWGYFWICLVLGPLGMFFLLRKSVRMEAAFLGGAFYLLNLGTLQHFYLPLEMFATAYGFLPWIFWAIRSRRLVWLAVFFFLAAPLAHTPTLFLASLAGVLLFTFFWDWRFGLKVLAIGLLINCFWLLPSLYFIFSHGSDVAGSHISQQFSSRAILANKEFANISDLALIKGFLFDWGHFDFSRGNYSDVLRVWKEHLVNPAILAIGYGLFALVVGGIIVGLKKRNRVSMAFFLVFLLAGIAILNFFPLPSGILSEGLRFPFTKFSILLMVSFAFFFGLAMDFLLAKLKFGWILTGLALCAMIIYMIPAFFGNLICPCVQVQFPKVYRETFDFFGKQNPNTRIAPFPIDSIYGWAQFDWKYEGAGFRWFGLPQPILDREFDRWMSTNENYYAEIRYALYSKNLPLFENVLEKYRVKWLLVDRNVINPSSPKALFFDELLEMIERSERFKLAGKFGKISIFDFQLQRPTKDFVSIATGLPKIGPAYKWGNLDRGFVDFGDYEEGSDVTFVNRTLFSGKRQEDLEFDPALLRSAGQVQAFELFSKCDDSSGETTECATVYLNDLRHDQGYLITTVTKNLQGLPLLFWIENTNSRRADLETYLPVGEKTSNFVLPPMERDGLGYALHFDNVSVGKERAVNEVFKVAVDPIDFEALISEKIGEAMPASYLPTESFEVWHPNPAWFRVDLTDPMQGETLQLWQSFENGWIAWDQNFRFLNHKQTNNWANGWELFDDSKTVYIFFWPQALEFVGFALLGALVLFYTVRVWAKRKSGS